MRSIAFQQYYQLTPYDFHDWDLAATPALIRTTGGKQLWKQNTGAPIGGGVITYLARGKQYVAVAAGLTSESWLSGGSNAKVAIYALP